MAGNWTTTASDFVYGSNTDAWGTTLTPADINASNFGIAFSAAISGTISLIPSAKIDFMQITVYYQPTTLPVKLAEFRAIAGQNKVNLFWKSAEETNFSHYEVERSNDGDHFHRIGVVMPNTQREHNYIDKAPEEHNYYRLKMVDLDKSFEYSNIVSAKSDASGQLLIAPNPVNDVCTFNLSGYKKGNYRLEIWNSSGQLMKTKDIAVQNEASTQLSFSNYLKGLYLVKIYSSNRDLMKTIKLLH
jgi:hypothetical protein